MSESKRRLSQLRIAKPCPASWDEMEGDQRQRYCRQCQLQVYNIRNITEDEAVALIEGAEGRVCVRLYQRRDGTVLTKECPVGLQWARQRLARLIMGTAAATWFLFSVAIGVVVKGDRRAFEQIKSQMRHVPVIERLIDYLDPPVYAGSVSSQRRL
jgi:hypothetical protein